MSNFPAGQQPLRADAVLGTKDPKVAPSAAQVAAGYGSVAERRAQIEHEEEVWRSRRQEQLAAQRSGLTPPLERILLWEKLHGVQMPRTPRHNLLRVIAEQTDLSLEVIVAEQTRRATATPVTAVPAAQGEG